MEEFQFAEPETNSTINESDSQSTSSQSTGSVPDLFSDASPCFSTDESEAPTTQRPPTFRIQSSDSSGSNESRKRSHAMESSTSVEEIILVESPIENNLPRFVFRFIKKIKTDINFLTDFNIYINSSNFGSRFMMFSVYDVLGLSCSRFMMFSVYHVLGL